MWYMGTLRYLNLGFQYMAQGHHILIIKSQKERWAYHQPGRDDSLYFVEHTGLLWHTFPNHILPLIWMNHL